MTVPIEVEQNGTTRALESVVIRARVRGFLTERHFVEGAMVKQGDLLLVIDEEPYKVALGSARARLSEAEATLRKAVESRMREVTESKLELDRAQLELAQIQERRSRALMAQRAGSAEDLDKSQAERRRSESQVEADLAQLEQARADYEIAIESARAEVAACQAAVRDAELNLGYCRMTAPISGRIGEARVKVGNLVGPDAAGGGTFSELATIQQLDPMGVDLRLSSRDLERITALTEAGLKVRLTRQTRSGLQTHPFEGECFFIDNTIDETTSTVLVKARVSNPDGKLLPGEYVQARMILDWLENVIVVPAPSVIESDTGTHVYVVDSEESVAVRPVSAGPGHRGFRVVKSGLEVGDRVIVDGLQMIRPGLRVTAHDVPAPAAGQPRETSAQAATETAVESPHS